MVTALGACAQCCSCCWQAASQQALASGPGCSPLARSQAAGQWANPIAAGVQPASSGLYPPIRQPASQPARRTHPAGVQVKGLPALVAVQDLGQVAVREEDAALEERVRRPAREPLHAAAAGWGRRGVGLRRAWQQELIQPFARRGRRALTVL